MLPYCIHVDFFCAVCGGHVHLGYAGSGPAFLWVPPPAHGLSSGAKGSAHNITGADLLGLPREEVDAMDAWWPVRGSEG